MQHTRTHTAGFSFVELLLAITLSTILVLVALVTFRAVTNSIKRIDAMSQENRLIRSGYFLAMKDADYWHSHADPSYPYLRHHMSTYLAAGSTTFDFKDGSGTTIPVLTGLAEIGLDANNAYDVRPFRPVNWKRDPADHRSPNWRQASDPATWYRNHIQANQVGGTYMGHGALYSDDVSALSGDWVYIDTVTGQTWKQYSYISNPTTRSLRAFCEDDWLYNPSRLTQGRPLYNFEPDFMESMDHISLSTRWGFDIEKGEETFFIGTKRLWGNPEGTLPMGLWVANMTLARNAAWQPWHLVGDYATISNCEGIRDPAYADATLDSFVDKRGRNLWSVYGHLGLYGCYNYLTAGEIAFLQTSSVNEVQASYTGTPEENCELNYSKGEVPWSQHVSGDVLIRRHMFESAGARQPGEWMALPAGFGSLDPTGGDPAPYTLHNRYNFALGMPTYLDANRESVAAYRPLALAADFESFNQDTFLTTYAARYYGVQFVDRYPQVLVYPRHPRPWDLRGSSYDNTWLNWDTMHPLVALLFDGDRYQSLGISKMTKGRIGWSITNTDFPAMDQDTWKDVYERHTHTCYHLPSNREDDPLPDLSSQAQGDLALATAILRYRLKGQDRAKCTIRLQNAKGQVRAELTFHVFTTTFRGARQHWGRLSDTDGDGKLTPGEGVDDGYNRRVLVGDGYE